MTESQSLQYDYEVSSPALDEIVHTALNPSIVMEQG